MSTTAEPSSSTSAASPSKERVEIMSKAVNLMGQGKRNLICGDVPMAVTQFEECCQILAQCYGEMAFECAAAYFSYGHALLELARMDSKVIESLEAEAEEDEEEEDDSEKSEEDGKSGGETPGTTEDEDRTDKSESLSSQDEVIDREAKSDREIKIDARPGTESDANKESNTERDMEEDEDEHNAGTDVTNLQLSWESLELAKIIYLKRKDKESQLKAAQAFLKLGEVGLETGLYEQSIDDIKECLKIQKEHLEPEDREIAESYYQLGLVYIFAGNHDPSVENFRKAVSVIEARIEKLKKIIETVKGSKATADLEIAYNANTEIKELEEVIPDIKQKIADTIEEKKTVAELKLLARREAEEKLIKAATLPGTSSGFNAMSSISGNTSELGTTTTGFSSTDADKSKDVKTLDISHLVRRKRKPEGAAEDPTGKKQKSESGGSTDSHSSKTQTDTSNGPLSSTQPGKPEPNEQTKKKDS